MLRHLLSSGEDKAEKSRRHGNMAHTAAATANNLTLAEWFRRIAILYTETFLDKKTMKESIILLIHCIWDQSISRITCRGSTILSIFYNQCTVIAGAAPAKTVLWP